MCSSIQLYNQVNSRVAAMYRSIVRSVLFNVKSTDRSLNSFHRNTPARKVPMMLFIDLYILKRHDVFDDIGFIGKRVKADFSYSC